MSGLRTAVQRAAVFIDRGQGVILLLVSPFLLFPTPARTLALLIVPGLWIVAGLSRGEFLTRTPLNGSLLLLAIMILVSLYATYDIAVSLPKITGLVLGLGVFFAVARLGQDRSMWRLGAVAFLALGIGMAGVGLLGTQWLGKVAFLSPLLARLPSVLRGLPGAESGFQPNEVAGSLVWVLPLLFVLTGYLFKHRLVGRRAWLALLISLGATLFVLGVFVLTQSRTGYIGLAAGVLLLIIIGAPLRWRRFILIGLVVLIVVGGGLLLSGSGRGVPNQLANSTLGSTAMSLDTLEGRLEVWSRAIEGIQDFPLTGMGLNTFRHIVFVLYPLTTIGPDFDLGHAHNEFLQAALDLGLPGLIAFSALYFGAFWMLREIWHTASTSMVRYLVLGLGGSLFAHLIYGLTDAVALGAKPGILFWMLLGLIAGLFLQTRPNSNLIGVIDRETMHAKETG
jgi:putative inorganic carbon (hco3(-)) transporter